jgi:hypothetical protein
LAAKTPAITEEQWKKVWYGGIQSEEEERERALSPDIWFFQHFLAILMHLIGHNIIE